MPPEYLQWLDWAACLMTLGLCSGKPSIPGWARMLTASVLLLCLVFGTAGWLLLPVTAAFGLQEYSRRMQRSRRGVVVRAIAVFAAMGSLALIWVFPLPKTASPTGPHLVGTSTIEVLNGESVLVAQLWYPASSAGPRSMWLPDPELAPAFPLNRIRYARANASRDAVVKGREQPWPVIVYEHGWLGHRAENTSMVEDLASHGFVVVAVDHPGQAKRITLSSGKVVAGTIPTSPDFSSAAGINAFKANSIGLLKERGRNIMTVRDALAGGALPSMKENARWDNIGIVGFSFGGTSALHLCSSNPLFKAGVNQDGLYLDIGVPKDEFLFLDQEMPEWLLAPQQANEGPFEKLVRESESRLQAAMAIAGNHRRIVAGAKHETFTDKVLLSPLSLVRRSGISSPQGVHDEIRFVVGEFFHQR